MSTTTISTFDGSAQALYTRERVREIYAACLNYLNRGTYYQSEISDAYDLYKEGMKSGAPIPELMRAASDELFPILDSIRELLKEYLLDIPESFYDKIYNYTCDRQEAMLDYYHFAYAPADEEKGQKEELIIYEEAYKGACEYYFGKGISELRELFQEYVVK